MAIIRVNPHQQALEAAQREIHQLQAQREWIDQRIAKLSDDIKSLSRAAAQQFSDELTLPLLCLRVLSFTPGNGVSVPKIREGLAAIGVILDYRSPLAVLHTTLGRLEQSGYVRAVPTADGSRSHFQILPAGVVYLQQVGG